MLEAIKGSLGGKIVIAMVGVLLLFVTAITLLDMRNESKDILKAYRANALVLASTMEKALVSSMKEGRNKDVQKALDYVGTQKEIVGVRVFDESGTILRSTSSGEIGGTVDKKTTELYKALDGGGFTSEDEPMVLSLLKPIYNSPECFPCHPPARKVNGVLQVRVSMKEAYDEINTNRLTMLKWGVAMVLCVALAEILLLKFLVTTPVRRLRDAMRKAAKGEDFKLELRYMDEIGELGESFKSMIKRISDLNEKDMEHGIELVRSQEALKAQATLSAVIDAMPDGVAIINHDMRLALINPKHRELFPTAKLGEPCYFCIHKRDSVCPHCGVVKVFNDGASHEHHSNVLQGDGSVRVVHSTSAPIKDESGAIINAVEVVRDVTERVALEKEIREKSWELERANKKLAKMAVTDGLTLLFNRRYFQDCLTREFKRLSRHRALPLLSIMMIDIDHFKGLNDAHGHQAGDLALKNLSKILKSNVRLTDIVARYGGEEFVIVMPETDMEGTMIVAERIRESVETSEFMYKDEVLKTTVSVGVACFPQEGIRSEEDLVKAADTALYKAKELGRNRVVMA